jgi:hypothetical protein
MAEITMTPYQYTYQNPINLTDPSGLMAEDPPSWFERNISRPVGNFFKGLFGGKKFNRTFELEVFPVAIVDDEGNITGYKSPEGFNNHKALELVGTTAAMLNETLSEIDPTGITSISRLLAVSATGMTYEDLINANNQILGINTNYSAT